eukprot:GEMP01046919.1.p1 GENE.GEMP01046919.1~~GEMP01046919.1.p1  ORF type:complete len:266 (+),score=90.04 GEMP01046919.1:45-800(+)
MEDMRKQRTEDQKQREASRKQREEGEEQREEERNQWEDKKKAGEERKRRDGETKAAEGQLRYEDGKIADGARLVYEEEKMVDEEWLRCGEENQVVEDRMRCEEEKVAAMGWLRYGEEEIAEEKRFRHGEEDIAMDGRSVRSSPAPLAPHAEEADSRRNDATYLDAEIQRLVALAQAIKKQAGGVRTANMSTEEVHHLIDFLRDLLEQQKSNPGPSDLNDAHMQCIDAIYCFLDALRKHGIDVDTTWLGGLN